MGAEGGAGSPEAGKKRRISLGWLATATTAVAAVIGSAIAIATFVRQPPPPDPAVIAYQKQVLATCGRVQGILAADHASEIIDLSTLTFQGPAIRKNALVQVLTNNLNEVRAEFDLLNGSPTPSALTAKRQRALEAETAWYGAVQDDIRFAQATVRDREPLTELNSQFAARGPNDVAVTSALSAALSDLAGSECRLRAQNPSGSSP